MSQYTTLVEAIKFFEEEGMCNTSLLFDIAKESGELETYQTKIIDVYQNIKSNPRKGRISLKIEKHMLSWYRELKIIPERD